MSPTRIAQGVASQNPGITAQGAKMFVGLSVKVYCPQYLSNSAAPATPPMPPGLPSQSPTPPGAPSSATPLEQPPVPPGVSPSPQGQRPY